MIDLSSSSDEIFSLGNMYINNNYLIMIWETLINIRQVFCFLVTDGSQHMRLSTPLIFRMPKYNLLISAVISAVISLPVC